MRHVGYFVLCVLYFCGKSFAIKCYECHDNDSTKPDCPGSVLIEKKDTTLCRKRMKGGDVVTQEAISGSMQSCQAGILQGLKYIKKTFPFIHGDPKVECCDTDGCNYGTKTNTNNNEAILQAVKKNNNPTPGSVARPAQQSPTVQGQTESTDAQASPTDTVQQSVEFLSVDNVGSSKNNGAPAKLQEQSGALQALPEGKSGSSQHYLSTFVVVSFSVILSAFSN